MTTLVELKEVLTAETAEDLLERASRKSKREVEALVASLKAPLPAPAPKASIRAIPPALPARPSAAPVLAFEAPPSAAPPALVVSPPQPTETSQPPEPRFEVKLIVSRQFVEALEHARRALSHSVQMATRWECCSIASIGYWHRRPGSTTDRRSQSRPPPAIPGRRAVPAAVARQVWKRDGGRCQWKLSSGGICGSRWKVQVDHIVPVARGGRSTESGCRLLCRIHNIQAGREVFGAQVMDRYRRRPDLGQPKSG